MIPSTPQALRRGNCKVVRNALEQPFELFDLSADPGEENDLASRHLERVNPLAPLVATAHTDTPDFPLTPGGAVKNKAKKKP